MALLKGVTLMCWKEAQLSTIEPYRAAKYAYSHYEHGKKATRLLMLSNILLLVHKKYVMTHTEKTTYMNMNTNNNDPSTE